MSPLNAIIGFASVLADSSDSLPVEKRRRYAGHILGSGESLQTLLEHLMRAVAQSDADLDLSWPSSGTFEVASAEPAETISTPPEPISGSRPVVLVADGDARHRELILAYLSGRGYDVCLAQSGEEALAIASKHRPDLVLLDPLMPNIDGFETARRLKALASDEYLPVVFVTTLADDDSRLRALNVGAEQCIQKPVGRHELRARVKNLLALRSQQRALADQNAQLKSLQRFKDDTTAMLVHDLKSPLSAMMMNLDYVLGDLPKLGGEGGVRDALEDCRVAGGRLFRMIANLLDIARSEEGRLTPKRTSVDIRELFGKVLEEYAPEAEARSISFVVNVDLDKPVSADPDLLGRVIANLVDNALRYARRSGKIRLTARIGAVIELSVAHEGPRLSADARRTIFDKYTQASATGAATMNRGLGLYFCRVAVEAHGGTISLIEEADTPMCFRVELPR